MTNTINQHESLKHTGLFFVQDNVESALVDYCNVFD